MRCFSRFQQENICKPWALKKQAHITIEQNYSIIVTFKKFENNASQNKENHMLQAFYLLTIFSRMQTSASINVFFSKLLFFSLCICILAYPSCYNSIFILISLVLSFHFLYCRFDLD